MVEHYDYAEHEVVTLHPKIKKGSIYRVECSTKEEFVKRLEILWPYLFSHQLIDIHISHDPDGKIRITF